jgi:hypothetical protein
MAGGAHLSHVAMSVPEGTLTDEFRAELLGFYGRILGWTDGGGSFRFRHLLPMAIEVQFFPDAVA